MSEDAGIYSLMDDLGEALHQRPDMIMMGGGNPAHIPAVSQEFRSRLQEISNSPSEADSMLGTYQSPQGSAPFREAMAHYLNVHTGWGISAENIAVSNGSQLAFFILSNLFCGTQEDESNKRMLLPLVPEYIGYADVGLTPEFFTAQPPLIEQLDEHFFRYKIDWDNVKLDSSIGAMCLSRPTNPTGNVIEDADLIRLQQCAEEKGIPLIIDCAYGFPFPNILFNERENPRWSEHSIFLMSLSKLGLPGLRSSVVVGNTELIRAYNQASTVLTLAASSIGPDFFTPYLQSRKIDQIVDQHILPFYRQARDYAIEVVKSKLSQYGVMMHSPEGAFFLWLWLKDLPISSEDLYQRLKDEGLLVLNGENFFIGIDKSWTHSKQCLRLSYCLPPEKIDQGIEILSRELAKVFG